MQVNIFRKIHRYERVVAFAARTGPLFSMDQGPCEAREQREEALQAPGHHDHAPAGYPRVEKCYLIVCLIDL